MMTRFYTLATFFLLITWCPARAADFVEQSHDEMRLGVKQFLLKEATHQGLEDTSVEVGGLDYRLKVHKCTKPLDYSTPHYTKFSSRITVEVNCNDKEPWKIYIQAQVIGYRKVVVTNNAVLRNQVINASDISLEKREVSSLNNGYFAQPKQVIGKISRWNLAMGTVIAPRQVKIPKLIKRGELVTILAKSSGIQVMMSGKALNDAIRGERVRVMNGKSRRIVEGNAIEKGVVQVNM